MEQIDVFKAKIVRPHVNIPWGFRLEGGAEHGLPLKVHRVSPGSPAHQIGISSNDRITEIGDVSTDRLTYNQAHELIAQFRDTIFLTIERKARGQVPQNPLVSHPTSDNPKSYQTYDMSGGKKPAPHYQQPAPSPQMSQPRRPQEQDRTKFYQTYDLNGPKAYVPPSLQRTHQYNSADFPTAQSRPFEAPPRPYRPVASPAAVPSPTTSVPDGPQFSQGVKYTPEEEKVGGDVSQSKTFKILQSLMQNDEEYSGVSGLPPPRSLEQERWKEDYARQHPGARVKVFVPQKYNSPMDLYSAPNVVDSFQQQATGYYEEMESKERIATVHDGVSPNVVYRSKTAEAVYEEDIRQHRSDIIAKRASLIMEEIIGSPIEERPAGYLEKEMAMRSVVPEPAKPINRPPVAGYGPPAEPLSRPYASPTSPFKPLAQPAANRPQPPKQSYTPKILTCEPITKVQSVPKKPDPEPMYQHVKYQPKGGKSKRVRPPPGAQDTTGGIKYGPIPDYVSHDQPGMDPDYIEQTVEHHITVVPQQSDVSPARPDNKAELNKDIKVEAAPEKEATIENIDESKSTEVSAETTTQEDMQATVTLEIMDEVPDELKKEENLVSKTEVQPKDTKGTTATVPDDGKSTEECQDKVEEPEKPVSEPKEGEKVLEANDNTINTNQGKQTRAEEEQQPLSEAKENEDIQVSKEESQKPISDETAKESSKETTDISAAQNAQPQTTSDEAVKTTGEPDPQTEPEKEMLKVNEEAPKEDVLVASEDGALKESAKDSEFKPDDETPKSTKENVLVAELKDTASEDSAVKDSATKE